MAAQVETDGRGRLRWSVVEDPAPVIFWEASPVGHPLPPATHLDIRREIGIRFRVHTEPTTSELIIQWYHSCCDGAGIVLFIKDLLVAYAAAFGQAPRRPQVAQLDLARLARRGRYGLTPGKLLRMAPQQLTGILGARQFLMRKPVPLVPHRACANDAPLPSNYPATLHYVLDREATAGLRKASMRRGVTSNDLLACNLFLALDEWRARQNIDGDDGQWMRMMIPMNLRTVDDRLLPAANLVSSVFLDRRRPDFADADRLLLGIHEEMSLIKRLRLGFTFVFSTAICRWLPGGLAKRIRADKCTISCIFTNLGTPFAHVPLPHSDRCIVAGNVTMLGAEFVAPVRPYSCVSVAVSWYADRLDINLHYDPRPLSAEQAADLLETFVRHIRASIAAPTSAVAQSERPPESAGITLPSVPEQSSVTRTGDGPRKS